MTVQPPADRPRMALDLTRWNRAGLERFEYVGGDAAVWLEELRVAMLSLFLRDGAEHKSEQRTPEFWRDLLLEDVDQWPTLPQRNAALKVIAWKDVFTDFPVDPETAGKRNRRLLEQYGLRSSDYTWEILRAFARAAHVLLGHLDAYANEGYLRTATQWDNVRRLAAMVNYQPTPPASATATVALLLDEEVDLAGETVTIDRALAMKYAPPEGGAPLIFETLQPVEAHPDLNAARAEDWDVDATQLDFSSATQWIAPPKATLAPGDLVVLAPAEGQLPDGEAVSIKTVTRDDEAEMATLELDPAPAGTWVRAGAALWTEPVDVRVGLPKSTVEQLVLEIEGAAGYTAGSVIEITGSTGTFLAVVLESADGFLYLDAPDRPTGAVTVQTFSPFEEASAEVAADYETPLAVETLFFKRVSGGGAPVITQSPYGIRTSDGEDIARKFSQPGSSEGLGYARTAGTAGTSAIVHDDSVPEVIPGSGSQPSKTVRFAGEPPKGLTVGNWFAARALANGDTAALRVEGVRTGADVYFVEFDEAPPADPDQTEFFGPMRKTLRPVDWNRSPAAPVVGGVARLEGLAEEARRLFKTGRTVLIVEETDDARRAVSANVTSVEEISVGGDELVELTLDGEETFADWKAGWTSFHANVTTISHGETKGGKVLGSGDGERARQTFQLKVKGVSFIPSSASSTGVVPDMDVTVDGETWEVRDDGDPTAEETRSYSVVLGEDDTHEIRFRRRLPSGSNNVLVSRHRLGVGSGGSGVPPWSFTKPMKKHRFVTGVVQPFATTGGADREPVSDMRANAPAKLSANDRAVSLADFERLAKRHASVWQAKARQVLVPGPRQLVSITVVPAGGGATTEKLRGDLLDFVSSRAVPGNRVEICDYESVPVTVVAKALVDTRRFDKEDVRDAAEAALVATFGLRQRALGQPFYVAEILAALEQVEGVSSAIVLDFARKPGAPGPLREATVGGQLATVFPADEQVVVVDNSADVAVTVESLVS